MCRRRFECGQMTQIPWGMRHFSKIIEEHHLMDLSLAGDLFMWSSGLNNHFYLGWTDSSFLENGRIISVVCPRVF